MADAKKGDIVQIHKIILKPDQRPDNLPDSSKSVNYECWIKGFLLDEDARIGDLVQVNPVYDHNFGTPQKEILSIGKEVKLQLKKMR